MAGVRSGGRLKGVEIDAIIAAGRLQMRDPFAWMTSRTAHSGKAEVLGVDTTLVMDASISRTLAGKYTFQLRSGNQQFRRLDVRGSHQNRDPAAELWSNRTHKHRWTDERNDALAYTPTDLPPTDSSFVGPSEYADVFAAFAVECGIELLPGWQWVAPSPGPVQTRM